MTEVEVVQKRRHIPKRVLCNSVQEGFWVDVQALTFGESKRIIAELAAANGNQATTIELTERLIRDHLVDWNWTTESGEPLPLPFDDPSALDSLTMDEITLLGNAINGNTDTPKA